MGISRTALATLVIAGTAIGGSTIAILANTAQADLKSSNISEISTKTPTTLPVDRLTPDPISTEMVPSRHAMPVNTTPDSSLPKITPPAFNAGGDDDESEGADDESDVSDDDYSDNSGYGDDEDSSDD
jgi:hypothetical protein